MSSKKNKPPEPIQAPEGFIKDLGITEELRDKLAKRDWNKPKYKADPANPDNWDTATCVANKFSGFRIYALTQEVELWVLGYIKAREKIDKVRANPGILATMHEEVFQTGGTLIAIDTPVPNVRHLIKPKK